MQLRKLSLIAAAIALSVTVTSCASHAQISASPSSSALAQASNENSSQSHLGLTDAQQAKIREIHHNFYNEMQKILTKEQQEQLKAARNNHQSLQDAVASLHLSDSQKNQLQQAIEAQKKQIYEVLKPEQIQQMQQFRAKKHSQNE